MSASKSQFTVEDGAIHISGGAGFLETERTAGYFVLQFEAKTNGDGLNSGVFFRAQEGTKEAPSNGYAFQVHTAFKNGDRQQPVDSGTGAIFRRVAARRVVSNDREWLTATLIADGPHFTTWVDGIQMVGTLTQNREMYALVRAGTNLFRVKKGNYMGQNFGLVMKISETEVELKEIVQDAAGEWVERPSKLELQEAAARQGSKR